MKLWDLKQSEKENLARISARVTWEDCGQPEREVFIETEKVFASDITANPHAFLVGCIIPALYFGEKRIHMDAAICPGLKEGLEMVMVLMKTWTKNRFLPLSIEAETQAAIKYTENNRQAALFLSGGMDSLAALRLNRLTYPKTHPGYVRDCFLVHGFDIGGVVERGAKYHVFERAKKAMAIVADDADVNLIPVYTNIRHLCDDRVLWLNQFFGAVLAAVAHAFAPRINLSYIASSYDIPNLVPCGSHPMLDPEYSSFDLKIRHRDVGLSRMEKLKIVAGWDTAFQNFRVCLANVPDRLNCGRCEKCVRTMLELLSIGVLNKTRAFVEDDVTPDMLEAFSITIRHREPFYEELIQPLKARGCHTIAKALEEKLKK